MKLASTSAPGIRPGRSRGLLLAALCLLFSAALLPAQDNVISGSGSVVGTDIHHPNGNIYDQVLMTGPWVTVAADPGQVVRVSFVDDNDDITQVEFTGTGWVTITLDPDTYQPPAPPAKYNQPGVNYVKGHATVQVSPSAADTYLLIFSVGRGNAYNQALFPAGMSYDAMADIQRVEIYGSAMAAFFGGNVRFTGNSGAIGILAPDTAVLHRLVVGDINASGSAAPLLRLGAGTALDWDNGTVLVAGGRLVQANQARIDLSSPSGLPFTRLNAVAGTLSSGDSLPAGTLSAQFCSLIPGSLTINGVGYSTASLLSLSFNDALGTNGLSILDFGDVTAQFSGGNSGTYTITVNTYVDGVFTSGTLTGTYSYAVTGPYQNQLSFSMTFSHLTVTAGGVSFSGTMSQLAPLVGYPVATRISAVATLDSSVSGTAVMTLDYTSGPPEVQSFFFDFEDGLNFGFF